MQILGEKPANNVYVSLKDAPCSKIDDTIWIILSGDTHGVDIEYINTPENFGCILHEERTG